MIEGSGSIPMMMAPPEDGSDPRRIAKRKSMMLVGRIECAHGQFDCVVLNLSLGGAKLRSVAPLMLGQTLTVTLHNRPPLHALVKWHVDDGVAGIHFTDEAATVAEALKGLSL